MYTFIFVQGTNIILVNMFTNTLLDFCLQLESLLCDSTFGISELQGPIITTPEQFDRLHTMTITQNIHAESQMYFLWNTHSCLQSQISCVHYLCLGLQTLSLAVCTLLSLRCLQTLSLAVCTLLSLFRFTNDYLWLCVHFSVSSLTHLNLKCTLLESYKHYRIWLCVHYLCLVLIYVDVHQF